MLLEPWRYAKLKLSKIEKIWDRYSKLLNKYETCSSCNGEICYEPYCLYATMNLDSKNNLYFTCGKKKIY